MRRSWLHIFAAFSVGLAVLAGCSHMEPDAPVYDDAGLGGYLMLQFDSPTQPETRAGTKADPGEWEENASGARYTTEANTAAESVMDHATVILFEKAAAVDASPIRYVYDFSRGGSDDGYKSADGFLSAGGASTWFSSIKALMPGDYVAVFIGNADTDTRTLLSGITAGKEMPLDMAYSYGDFKNFYKDNFLPAQTYDGTTSFLPTAHVDEAFTMPSGYGKKYPYVKSIPLVKPMAKVRFLMSNLDENGHPYAATENYVLDNIKIINWIDEGPVAQWRETPTSNAGNYMDLGLLTSSNKASYPLLDFVSGGTPPGFTPVGTFGYDFGELFTSYIWSWSPAFAPQSETANTTAVRLTLRNTSDGTSKDYDIPLRLIDLVPSEVIDFSRLPAPPAGISAFEHYRYTILPNFIYEFKAVFRGPELGLKITLKIHPWNLASVSGDVDEGYEPWWMVSASDWIEDEYIVIL